MSESAGNEDALDFSGDGRPASAHDEPFIDDKSRERYGSLWPIKLVLHAIRRLCPESGVVRQLVDQGLQLLWKAAG